MKCRACGHPRHGPECRVDIMVDLKERSPLTPPFHLQCWCDGRSGPVVITREGKRLMNEVYDIR